MSAVQNPDAVRPRASSMTIEVTTHCSLKCVGCARTVAKTAGAWRDRHMSADLFARVCDHLPPLERLTLHGIGEPTLNPDYPAIVAMAAATGRFQVIGANSHALARDADYYRRLVETGLNELYVSVDSLTQAVADRTRTGTRVPLLRRRLEAFAEMGLPVFITLVASRFNLHDVAATLDALNDIGPFPVSVQEFVDLGVPEGCLTAGDRRALSDVLDHAASRCTRLSISRTLSLAKTWEAPAICADPWSGFGVTVDGYLTPCCLMWDPAPLGHLNLGVLSVEAALASPAYRAFLAAYLVAAPSFCDGCQKNTRPVSAKCLPLSRHPAERELAAVHQ